MLTVGKVRFAYIAAQMLLGAVRYRQGLLKSALMDFGLQPFVAQVYRFNGFHLCNPWIITYYPTLEEWKAELAQLADLWCTVCPQIVTHQP